MKPKALSPVTLVRLLRRRSQREIAHAIGISRARLSQIEAGNDPPYALMRKLAAELESEVDVLFPEDGGKELREKLRADLGLKRKTKRRAGR